MAKVGKFYKWTRIQLPQEQLYQLKEATEKSNEELCRIFKEWNHEKDRKEKKSWKLHERQMGE